jgi:ribosome-interacting GTPase 1
MTEETMDEEIRELEERIAEVKASKPAHDTTGAHERRLLELEDELDEKRQARAEARGE